MPVARFQMPDGRIGRFEVPDGTTPEQAQDLISQFVASDSAKPVTKAESFAKGLRDPIDAGAQMLTNVLPEGVVQAGNQLNNWLARNTGLVGELPAGGVDQQVREAERQYQSRRAASGDEGLDVVRLAGNVVSPANVALASRIPQAATLGGRMGIGAATGAGFGTLSPVAEGDFAEEKLKQAGFGAIGGAALPAVAGGLARVIKPNASANPNLQTLTNEGIKPTIGQTLGGRLNALEEKATSIPILGDAIASARGKAVEGFNVAALNRAVAPIGGKIDKTGRDGITAVKQQLKDAYDDVLPKLQFKADGQFATELSKVQTMVDASLARARGHMAPPGEADIFDNIIQKQVIRKLTPAGTMSGTTFKQVESELTRLAKGYKGDPSFDKRQIGAALDEVLASMRASLERANPSQAKRLQDINKGFANYARLRQAAGMLGAEEGLFSPAQLQNAVKMADKSVGKGRFAQGDALLQDLSEAGKTVLGNKVPNSGTAERLMYAGGAIGSGVVAPAIPLSLIGGAGLYSGPAQNTLRALVTRRPQGASRLADLVREGSPYALPAGAQLGLQLSEQ